MYIIVVYCTSLSFPAALSIPDETSPITMSEQGLLPVMISDHRFMRSPSRAQAILNDSCVICRAINAAYIECLWLIYKIKWSLHSTGARLKLLSNLYERVRHVLLICSLKFCSWNRIHKLQKVLCLPGLLTPQDVLQWQDKAKANRAPKKAQASYEFILFFFLCLIFFS